MQLTMDPSGEQLSNKSKKIAHATGLDMWWLEESTQWANIAENYIGILKEAIRQDLLKSNVPLVVLDYYAEWRVRVHNLTTKDKFDISNMNPFTQVTGDVTDISNMCVHKFYDMVQYQKQKVGFPLLQSKLDRFLGSCCNNGNKIPLTMAEMDTPDAKRQCVIFDNI